MNASQLFQDLATNCLTEVTAASNSFYSTVRGLTVRQSFYVYPDNTVVCLDSFDGGYAVFPMDEHEQAAFRHIYKM